MALDKTGSLLDQFLGDSLLVEGDEAEVLWFVVLGPVYKDLLKVTQLNI